MIVSLNFITADFRLLSGRSFRNADRLELRHDLLFPASKPRRQVQLGPELGFGFVLQEPARYVAAALDQNATGTAAIHRVEVKAVLNFGRVRVSQFFVNRLLLGQSNVVGAPERDMVMRAGAESPASSRTIRLMLQRDGLVRTARAGFEPVITSVN